MFHLSKSKHINFVLLHRAADNLVNGFSSDRKRRRLERTYKILKYFLLTAAVLFLFSLVLFSAKILSLSEFYSQAISGQTNLEQAIIFAEQEKFDQAMVLAGAALDNFNFLTNELGRIRNQPLINKLSFISGQLNSFESLFSASGFLSQAVYGGADFGKNLGNLSTGDKKLKFSEFSPTARRQVLGKIFESAPELNGIKANLALAYLRLDQADTLWLLSPLKEKIFQTKKQIKEAEQILEKAVSLSQLLPALAGYPEATEYLVILQNNNELRPTGGVLDTYGILKFKDGDIASFSTRDIRYLGGLAQNKIRIIPPEPLKKYLTDKWYLRDANWAPDWPTAAQKISWFYQRESGFSPAVEKNLKFDGVIVLTPKLITDFLRIIGPVSVQGQIYDQTNFQNLLDPGSKKENFGEIVKELKNKVFVLPSKEWSKFINIMADNLAAKNLLLYFDDEQLEKIAFLNGWGGEIKRTAGDYLMVVDANLDSAKIDADLNRGLEYKVSQSANGLFSKLTLNYGYRDGLSGGETEYKSYIRVYAPLGSQLIKINGYEPKQIEIGDEFGKIWFGFYFKIQPGEIKNLTIEYKLPAFAAAPRSYEFYLQKQPGKEINDAKVDLNFLNDIKSYSPVSLSVEKVNSSRIRWEGDLNLDRSFMVIFD